jgi:hypothetical protein
MLVMNEELLPYVNLGLGLLLLLLMLWQIFRVSRLNQIRKHFYSVGLKKNLEQIVIEQDQSIRKINENIDNVSRLISQITETNKNNFQKIGFVRFSPFGEAGNLSFALALLDAHLNGILISSFHGREGTRIYSKEIKNAKCKAKLTEEEKQALEQAINLNET